MLVLHIRPGRKLQIGNATIINLESRPIKVGIDAPKEVQVTRDDAKRKVPDVPSN